MAKVFGINGLISGRLGSTVFAIRNGMQVARQYNPSPSNPKSVSQVGSRVKFKLLSQLAQVMSTVIAIPKNKGLSARNRFSQINYKAISEENETASVALEQVKITDSVISLPEVVGTREGATLNVRLAGRRRSGYLDAVVYVMFTRESDGTLRFSSSLNVNDPATDSGGFDTFPGTLLMSTANDQVVVYAYGMHFLTESARATYGNMSVNTESVATLVAERLLISGETEVTETRALISTPA